MHRNCRHPSSVSRHKISWPLNPFERFDIHGFVWWKPCKLRVVASVVSQPHLNVFDLQTVRLCQTQRKCLRSDSHVSHSIFGDQCSKWKAHDCHDCSCCTCSYPRDQHEFGIRMSLVFTRIHSYSLVFTRPPFAPVSLPLHSLGRPLPHSFILALSLLF